MSSRKLVTGAAQMGPIARSETRAQCVSRHKELLRQAKSRGCDLVVFPELAFTTFFPHWFFAEQSEIDSFFETEMPGPETIGLFDEAKRLSIAFCIGYAELVEQGGRKHASTRQFWSTSRAASSANTERCICPGIPIIGRSDASSISRSATSSRGTSDSRFGARWAASWACASATIGAGLRPIA